MYVKVVRVSFRGDYNEYDKVRDGDDYIRVNFDTPIAHSTCFARLTYACNE